MTTRILHAVSLLVVVASAGLWTASAVPVQYMSFYEYDPKAMAGWVNVGVTDNMTAINIGTQLGTQHLFTLEGMLYEFTGPGSMQLRSNWQQVWSDFVPTAKELFANKSIIGFFMGDELVWNGLDPASLQESAALVKATFPDAIVWENEATDPLVSGRDFHGHVFNYTKVPPALDYISIDMYHMEPVSGNFALTVKAFYTKYIYPKLAPHQHVWLVPGAFASNVNPACDEACYDTMCAKDANDFYAWAVSDELVAGFAPWHWHYDAGCKKFKDEIGTDVLPKTRAAWTAIGKKVIAGEAV